MCVILDDKLLFSQQITKICNSLSKVHGIMYSVAKFLTRDARLTLYYSIAYSQLIQSIVIWGGATDDRINPIKVKMNNILRTILNVKRDLNNIPMMHVIDMYECLEILQYHDVYNYFLLKFVRDAQYCNYAVFDRYYSHLLPQHNHNTRHSRFNIPSVRLEIEKHFTVYKSVIIYNAIPCKLLAPMCADTFKKK